MKNIQIFKNEITLDLEILCSHRDSYIGYIDADYHVFQSYSWIDKKEHYIGKHIQRIVCADPALITSCLFEEKL